MGSLKSVSDVALINRLKILVEQEKHLTLKILPHIVELKRRSLYRDLGFRSLYDYCTRELKYSESGAMRRICAARAIEKCPTTIEYLEKGLVNLSTLSLAWKYVTPEVLDRISGKSKREVEAIVAEFNPGLYTKDSIKPVVVERLVIQPESAERRQADKECKEIYRRGGGKLFASVGDSTPQQKEEVVRYKVKMHDVRCLVDDEVMRQLERCKILLSGKFPDGLDYNGLLRELARNWLECHDPLKREERRAVRKRSSKSIPMLTPKSEHARHIPAATRDVVFKRDEGRCTFVGNGGKRCNSSWDLEVHHDRTPFGRGGRHSIKNLRLLCRAHNQLEAEKEYGEQAINKHYIKEPPVVYLLRIDQPSMGQGAIGQSVWTRDGPVTAVY